MGTVREYMSGYMLENGDTRDIETVTGIKKYGAMTYTSVIPKNMSITKVELCVPEADGGSIYILCDQRKPSPSNTFITDGV